MRAILINPATQQVTVKEVLVRPHDLREMLGSTPHRAGRLPNGDVVLAAAEAVRYRKFSLGGSHPMNGPAIVVGRTDRFREHQSAKSDVAAIRRLVRWVA